jgi:hypothetical protein
MLDEVTREQQSLTCHLSVFLPARLDFEVLDA